MRITNAEMLHSHGNISGRKDVINILEAGLQAADPYRNAIALMKRDGNILTIGNNDFEATNDPNSGTEILDLDKFRKIIVVGAGKGIQKVAKAFEDVLGEYLTEGHMIAKYGDDIILEKLGITLAAHPIPDDNSEKGSKEILKFSEDITEDDLVITIIGNGGSSLMTLPVETVKLDDVRELTRIMQIEKGAPTNELNVIRNHLDQLKGGKLSKRFSPAKMIHIAVTDISRSDINGKIFDYDEFMNQNIWLHNLPDNSTFEEAVKILKKYEVWDLCSEEIRKVLSEAKPEHDTVKFDDFKKMNFRVFGIMPGKLHFIPVMKKKAEDMGYHTVVLAERIMAQSQEAAKFAGAICKNIQDTGQPAKAPIVILSTGEMVVPVGKNNGVGGRNQEYALAMAKEIAGRHNIVVGSCDSDGTDGPGGLNIENAPKCLGGGIVDGYTWEEALGKNVDIDQALLDHNTSEALWRLDCGVVIEQNISINDLTVILIQE